MKDVVVLGLGNLLLEDDGIGVEAVRRFAERYEAPPGVRVLDGGTLGLALLALVAEADALILVDAIMEPAPPGAFVRIEDEDVPPATLERLSPHQIGVADLLFGARFIGHYPERVVLLGLVPERMDLRIGQSPAVAAHMDELVERVAGELAALGFTARRRDVTAPRPEVSWA